MPVSQYIYRANVVDVHDGDTFTADLDLGFRLTLRAHIRLIGCNARELSDPGGPPARDALAQLIGGKPVFLNSVNWDKYGDRIDADVWLSAGKNVTKLMIDSGWAAAWDGKGTPPVPPWPHP